MQPKQSHQTLLQARPLDRLEIVLGDDHVGIDIDDRQRRSDAGEGGELVHGRGTRSYAALGRTAM